MANASKVTSKVENKKREILSAAEDCLKERGLEKTNMREIAKKAKLSLGTISYYFPTKDDMLVTIFKDFINRVLKTAHYDDPAIEPKQRVLNFINGFITEFINDPGRLRVFFDIWSHTTNNPKLRDFLKDYYRNSLKWLKGLLDEGNRTGEFHIIDTAATAAHFFAILDGLKLQINLLGVDSGIKKFRKNYERFILESLNETDFDGKGSPALEERVSDPCPTKNDLFNLKGKTAVIAGGSAASILMTAEVMAKAGANIILCGKDTKSYVEAVNKITGAGVRVSVLFLDPAGPDQMDAHIERSMPGPGGIDILINNFINTDRNSVVPESSLHTLDDNSHSPIGYSLAFVKKMIVRGKGKIINLMPVDSSTSTGETLKSSFITAYTKDMSRKLQPKGINVNAIASGNANFEKGKNNSSANNTFAGILNFLSSPASDYITGQVFAADEGAVNYNSYI